MIYVVSIRRKESKACIVGTLHQPFGNRVRVVLNAETHANCVSISLQPQE